MPYLTAQAAADNIWVSIYNLPFDLTEKLRILSNLELDLTSPEFLSDEGLLETHEFLGSIFHHPEWNRAAMAATQLPIPGSSFDYYCIDRVYLAVASHARSRAWEYNPKHADWVASFSTGRTGGYVSCLNILPDFDWTDPALVGPLDAPAWVAAGSCCEPHVGSSETYPSHPRFKCIPARLG